jgi:hypothetical protein
MCLRNKDHIKTETVCAECYKNINENAGKPDLNQLSPHLRGLFLQLTQQKTDFDKCWSTNYKNINIEGKKLKIENIYYGFYKADIGNFCLKRICGTIGCVNPAHLKSRFEQPNITKTIRAGFTRKPTKIADLTDSEWLKQP